MDTQARIRVFSLDDLRRFNHSRIFNTSCNPAVCIGATHWCDGAIDCPNGEDEREGCMLGMYTFAHINHAKRSSTSNRKNTRRNYLGLEIDTCRKAHL